MMMFQRPPSYMLAQEQRPHWDNSAVARAEHLDRSGETLIASLANVPPSRHCCRSGEGLVCWYWIVVEAHLLRRELGWVKEMARVDSVVSLVFALRPHGLLKGWSEVVAGVVPDAPLPSALLPREE